MNGKTKMLMGTPALWRIAEKRPCSEPLDHCGFIPSHEWAEEFITHTGMFITHTGITTSSLHAMWFGK